MRGLKWIVAAAAACGAVAAQGQAGGSVVYIQAGKVLDRPGQQPRGASTIVVRDGKVAELRDGFVAPEAGATLVDLKDRFVLPGLIDMHVHLFSSGDPLTSRLEAMNRDREDEVLQASARARTTLLAGFTTVRDLGGPPRGIRALRDAIARGELTGPTVVNAGEMISISGGHGDMGGLSEEAYDAFHPRDYNNVCNGPDDCRRAAREQVRLGADVIKFAATGGVLSNVAGGLGQQMTDAEMKAVIDTAHGFGRKAAAHSHAKEGTLAAVNAGVDTIDHGTFLDEATAKAMVARGTWLVPTMLASATAVENARKGVLPAAVLPKAEEAAAAARASHVLAVRMGVRIAFGTDTGVSKHGDNAKEFALMVDRGMTPMAAIAAATTGAAEALGQKDRLGRIAPGMAADIIAVAGDPLADVRRLETVGFVMKQGKVIKQD
ncbi:imidazolonepropionase-like amidohydrolase [Novosphingobium kunmingense]|uniref:Imidazolonepropionase-like amidohydrolase n=1 Tax=Novosphingobium kunmingense TaxID=1211806 RepID=A0A2N0H7C8_9SPHN|nr:amidohydrolase family protein [Novosphingobium kunmingense]PKB14834.1 imidazolonepropionase-like amidohydrolase [Novosphingobium kunmingense]